MPSRKMTIIPGVFLYLVICRLLYCLSSSFYKSRKCDLDTLLWQRSATLHRQEFENEIVLTFSDGCWEVFCRCCLEYFGAIIGWLPHLQNVNLSWTWAYTVVTMGTIAELQMQNAPKHIRLNIVVNLTECKYHMPIEWCEMALSDIKGSFVLQQSSFI